MTAALHTPQDSGVQRTPGTGYSLLRITNEEPPLRGVLFFCILFFWTSKRKVWLNRQKKFFSPKSTNDPNQTTVDFASFCLTNERTPAADFFCRLKLI